MGDINPLSNAYCKEHDIYLCEECEHKQFMRGELKMSEEKTLVPGWNDKHLAGAIYFLAEACYNNAKDHGFWDDEDALLKIIGNDKFESDTNRKRLISLFNSEKIALEMSELAERLETLRKDPIKLDEHCPDFFNVEIEVADLIIRALDFAGRRNLRIGEALIAKMKYN